MVSDIMKCRRLEEQGTCCLCLVHADDPDESRESPCRGLNGVSVTTEEELRRELLRAESGGKIVLNATEWKLEETLEIASREVCLEGATNGVVVHCPPDEKGSAVVVRCAALLQDVQRVFFTTPGRRVRRSPA